MHTQYILLRMFRVYENICLLVINYENICLLVINFAFLKPNLNIATISNPSRMSLGLNYRNSIGFEKG